MSNVTIDVAKDFFPLPSGRFAKDGTYTGERFRNEFLKPKLNSLSDDGMLVIDFDGVSMAAPSFLEEAFGGLVRIDKYEKKTLLKRIKIISARKSIIEDILDFIRDAKPSK